MMRLLKRLHMWIVNLQIKDMRIFGCGCGEWYIEKIIRNPLVFRFGDRELILRGGVVKKSLRFTASKEELLRMLEEYSELQSDTLVVELVSESCGMVQELEIPRRFIGGLIEGVKKF